MKCSPPECAALLIVQVHAMYHGPLDGAVHISHVGPLKKDAGLSYMGQQHFGAPLHSGRRGPVPPFDDRDEVSLTGVRLPWSLCFAAYLIFFPLPVCCKQT